jgi:hypothetical protein
MKARGAKMQDDLASAWASLQVHVQEQFENIRAKLEEKRDDHDATAAERRAERAEANAADAIDFASWAVDDPDEHLSSPHFLSRDRRAGYHGQNNRKREE